MLFNSLDYLIFFPLVIVVHFLLPERMRWVWLLLASCYFYMVFSAKYILLLFLLIGVNYSLAILMEKSSGKLRGTLLWASILADAAVLGFFKYFNFLNGNVTEVLAWFNFNNPVGNLDFLLPIGLSFHTFQSISYSVEVYRGNQKAERHLGIYALFILFFPQLVAGPIERPAHVLPQMRLFRDFDEQDAIKGIRLILWGLFKKIVIADRVALIVNHVYASPQNYGGCVLLLATICFAIQIYCDFSGYSDIALGSARVLRIRLMTNFDSPYCSRSIAEFWSRWHISLSTWFRDYLYIPLGGNRVSHVRWIFNTLLTFFVSGLWHGANWTYIVWGLLNGTYLIFGRFLKSFRSRAVKTLYLDRVPALLATLQVITVFSLICLSWIFFRAASVSEAWLIVTRIFTVPFFTGLGSSVSLANLTSKDVSDWLLVHLRWDWCEVAVACLAVLLLESWQWLQRRRSSIAQLDRFPRPLRYAAYYGLILLIIAFGSQPISQKFIYFQF